MVDSGADHYGICNVIDGSEIWRVFKALLETVIRDSPQGTASNKPGKPNSCFGQQKTDQNLQVIFQV